MVPFGSGGGPAGRTEGRFIWAAPGIAGVGLIFADHLSFSGGMKAWGRLAILLSAAAGSLSGVILKRWGCTWSRRSRPASP